MFLHGSYVEEVREMALLESEKYMKANFAIYLVGW